MKKLIFLFTLLFAAAAIFAQTPDVPVDVGEVLEDPGRLFKQLAGLVGLTIFVVGVIKPLLKTEKDWPKVVLSIVVALVLSLLSNAINFGLYADSAWLDTVIWGAGIGAAAGMIFDIHTMKTLVNLLLSIIRFRRTPE